MPRNKLITMEQLGEAMDRADKRLDNLEGGKVSLPPEGNGTAGQFAISDGNGGIVWISGAPEASVTYSETPNAAGGTTVTIG